MYLIQLVEFEIIRDKNNKAQYNKQMCTVTFT